MDLKSTGQKIRTTGARNCSTTGSNQQIAHSDSPIKHPVAPRGNPGKIAIKPEVAYDKPAKGITGGNGGRGFQPVDAAHERVCKC